VNGAEKGEGPRGLEGCSPEGGKKKTTSKRLPQERPVRTQEQLAEAAREKAVKEEERLRLGSRKRAKPGSSSVESQVYKGLTQGWSAVKILLDGANLKEFDFAYNGGGDRYTSLIKAAELGYSDIVEGLLKAMGERDPVYRLARLVDEHTYQNTPLRMAAENGKADTVDLLLEQFKVELRARKEDGASELEVQGWTQRMFATRRGIPLVECAEGIEKGRIKEAIKKAQRELTFVSAAGERNALTARHLSDADPVAPMKKGSVLGGLIALPGGAAFSGEDMRPVWGVYEQEACLGSGAFGTVFRARARDTSEFVALKMITKSTEASIEEKAISEFHMCASVVHPHIMRVFAYFNTPSAIYIASELAAHGELRDRLAKDRTLAAEGAVSQICAQVLSALVYLHERRMVHHDVKPENILATSKYCDDDARIPVVVLSDFGTARLCETLALAMHEEGGEILRGTAAYCGPEVFEGYSGDRTDVYAFGVTLFELLAGEKPFEEQFDLFSFDDDGADRYQQMRDMSVEADWSRLRGVSDAGCKIIKRMMTKAYDQRPTTMECSEVLWFRTFARTDGGEIVSSEESQARIARLIRRANLGFYSKALLNMMAAQLPEDILNRERGIFKALDRDGSGRISVDELALFFNASDGQSREQAELALKHFDLDRSASLDFNEWVSATASFDARESKMLAARVGTLFTQLDANGSGAIELPDLRLRFGAQTVDGGQALESFFRELDTDNGGAISLEAFSAFWRRIG
jgi:calcium-dependent protein kinase